MGSVYGLLAALHRQSLDVSPAGSRGANSKQLVMLQVIQVDLPFALSVGSYQQQS